MKFPTPLLFAMLASAAFGKTMRLSHGGRISVVTVGEPNLNDTLPGVSPVPGGGHPLPEGKVNHCSGSSRCTNGQKFRNQCSSAYMEIEDLKYGDPNGSGGACSGNCGFFVEGADNCRATQDDFMIAYDQIRTGYNCLACGSVYVPGTKNKCWIKFDYVSHCR